MDTHKIPISEDELARHLLQLSESLTDYQKRVKPMLSEVECRTLARHLLADLEIYRTPEITDIPPDYDGPDYLIG